MRRKVVTKTTWEKSAEEDIYTHQQREEKRSEEEGRTTGQHGPRERQARFLRVGSRRPGEHSGIAPLVLPLRHPADGVLEEGIEVYRNKTDDYGIKGVHDAGERTGKRQRHEGELCILERRVQDQWRWCRGSMLTLMKSRRERKCTTKGCRAW